jgi:hypothetical protein
LAFECRFDLASYHAFTHFQKIESDAKAAPKVTSLAFPPLLACFLLAEEASGQLAFWAAELIYSVYHR